jgi:hypothetical protein
MELRVTLEGAEAYQARLHALGRLGPVVAMRATNDALGAARTDVRRGLAADSGLTQAVVRQSMSEVRATVSRPEARLTVTGRRIPLIDFRARQTRTGVSYRLPGGRNTVPGGFIQTMRSGHRGVFKRRGRPRLPIDELFGPSLPHIVRRRGLFDPRRYEAVLRRRFEHHLTFLAEQGRVEAEAG